MKNLQKGFTLIELLVVVAIIGILSTVVLASLGNARTRANISKVKAQLSQVGASMTLYLDANPNPAATTLCTAAPFSDATSGLSKLVLASSYPSGTAITCGYNASGNWAVQAAYSSKFFCVDDTTTSYSVKEGTATMNPTDGAC